MILRSFMKKHSNSDSTLFNQLIGLGETSMRKTYYPELQKRLDDLERFKALLDESNDAILLIQLPVGDISDFNKSACEQLGYQKQQLCKMSVLEIDIPGLAEIINRLYVKNKSNCGDTFNTEIKKKNGKQISLEIAVRIVNFNNNTYAVAVARDISDRKKVEEKIKLLAYHDPLTGLPNRTLFIDRLNVELLNADNHPKTLAVLFLDLDRFKIINDSLGHSVGDWLLKVVSKRLNTFNRDDCIVARMGGDEFIILLTDISHPDEVKTLAQNILDVFQVPFTYDDLELHVTVSIGVSIYPKDGLDVITLMKHADIAMYKSKDKGGNSCQFYDPSMNAQAHEQLILENSLRRALEREEFVVHYQPQVNINTGQIVGVEALVRWQHPDLGLLYPDKFISLAEKTGLIVPIGEWVMRTACRKNKEWQDKGYPAVRVAVNLSTHQFLQMNLVKTVSDILEETGLDPQWLEMEITESIAMYNEDFIINMLDQLRKLGVCISLDDFGSGYSSLSYLRRFPINRIKIDKSFIFDLSNNADDRAIVLAAIAMAKNLRLKVIAEGVETNEQLNFLKEKFCDEAQGFLFSKAVTAEEVESLFSKVKK